MASSSGEGTRWKICSGGEDRPGRPSGLIPREQPAELRWGRPSSESQREREKGNRTVLEEPGGQVTETTLSVLDTKKVCVPEFATSFYPLPGSLCYPPPLSRALGSYLVAGRRLPRSWTGGHHRQHRTQGGWVSAGSGAACPQPRGSEGAARGTGPAPSATGAGAAGKQPAGSGAGLPGH